MGSLTGVVGLPGDNHQSPFVGKHFQRGSKRRTNLAQFTVHSGNGALLATCCKKFIAGMFEDRKFPFPSLDVQKRLMAELNEFSEVRLRLQNIYQGKLAALEALKKSLLPQAFTGEL